MHIFCVDLEEWYDSNLGVNISQKDKDSIVRVTLNTRRLLELFREFTVTATFFVLGTIAEKYPELIAEIISEGHEIASHGYNHQLAYTQTKEQFTEDLLKSKQLLEPIVGHKIKGYRAPSWSIIRKNIWMLEVIQNLGYIYDSSIFPTQNSLYGIPDAPRYVNNPEIDGRKLGILEIPPSTFKVLGRCFGFSGGFYLRILPVSAVKCLLSLNNSKNPGVFYIHPREIDKSDPKFDISFPDSFIHRYGVKSCETKLIKLFKIYQFTSIEKYFNL